MWTDCRFEGVCEVAHCTQKTCPPGVCTGRRWGRGTLWKGVMPLENYGAFGARWHKLEVTAHHKLNGLNVREPIVTMRCSRPFVARARRMCFCITHGHGMADAAGLETCGARSSLIHLRRQSASGCMSLCEDGVSSGGWHERACCCLGRNEHAYVVTRWCAKSLRAFLPHGSRRRKDQSSHQE